MEPRFMIVPSIFLFQGEDLLPGIGRYADDLALRCLALRRFVLAMRGISEWLVFERWQGRQRIWRLLGSFVPPSAIGRTWLMSQVCTPTYLVYRKPCFVL